MAVVCKMFIRSRSEFPGSPPSFELGAVCRGDINKEWAAATPSGTLKCGSDADGVLEAVWAERAESGVEVLVHIKPDLNGTWLFERCGFSYGGCAVEFRSSAAPWGTLALTINANAATKQMRDAFARSLSNDKPAAFSLTVSRSSE